MLLFRCFYEHFRMSNFVLNRFKFVIMFKYVENVNISLVLYAFPHVELCFESNQIQKTIKYVENVNISLVL